MVNKDQSIIMQVAAKIAVDLVPKTSDVNANVVAFAEAYDAVCEIILTSQGINKDDPSTIVKNAYPASPAPSQQLSSSDEALFTNAFPTATPHTVNIRIKGKQHGPIPEWLPAMCAEKGVTEVWDNRDGLAQNPKRPWFKSTTSEDAFWAPRGR